MKPNCEPLQLLPTQAIACQALDRKLERAGNLNNIITGHKKVYIYIYIFQKNKSPPTVRFSAIWIHLSFCYCISLHSSICSIIAFKVTKMEAIDKLHYYKCRYSFYRLLAILRPKLSSSFQHLAAIQRQKLINKQQMESGEIYLWAKTYVRWEIRLFVFKANLLLVLVTKNKKDRCD